jgi:glycosidase
MSEALNKLSGELSRLAQQDAYNGRYTVPAQWVNPASASSDEVLQVNPYAFYHDKIQGVLSAPDNSPVEASTGGEWSKQAVVYNMFVRQTTAWDHNGDGVLGLDDISGGFRETGTFLKAISMLPYLQHLGFNTVHLLPITAIGSDGNKGVLGSPYAIKNPYTLDPRLGEPCLSVDVATQFKAFVEAAHRYGMRVVVEFVFRTASKDSDWVREHPEWFYWIDANVPDRDPSDPDSKGYGNPRFPEDTLKQVKLKVKNKELDELPPPPADYRALYSDPPISVRESNGRLIGTTSDGKYVRIPGAFADWPPDDIQPPWGDVTYMKMYDHPDFNYIAYNTIRMYDEALTVPANIQQGLWDHILNVLPFYQKEFNIDGVMIDMGHALPKQLMHSIVLRARENNPNFAFWEENFALTKKSREEGYNITMGYLWSDEHDKKKLKAFVDMLAIKGSPIPFFATPETHNTNRAAARTGATVYSRMALLFNTALPGVLFVHQGFELGDTLPVNTGLGFTAEDLEKLPSASLPLFGIAQLTWTSEVAFSEYLAKLIKLRKEWKDVICDSSVESFQLAKVSHDDALCYVRSSMDNKRAIAVLVNLDCEEAITTEATIPLAGSEVIDLLTGERYQPKTGSYSFELGPGEGLILQLSSS